MMMAIRVGAAVRKCHFTGGLDCKFVSFGNCADNPYDRRLGA
jgi:hypothetical protein